MPVDHIDDELRVLPGLVLGLAHEAAAADVAQVHIARTHGDLAGQVAVGGAVVAAAPLWWNIRSWPCLACSKASSSSAAGVATTRGVAGCRWRVESTASMAMASGRHGPAEDAFNVRLRGGARLVRPQASNALAASSGMSASFTPRSAGHLGMPIQRQLADGGQAGLRARFGVQPPPRSRPWRAPRRAGARPTWAR